VTARGGGQTGVLTATEITPDTKSSGKTFQRVSGTVQQAGPDRVMFKTRDGLVLPIDVGSINGLPYLAANEPATLYYEQGSKQEVVGVSGSNPVLDRLRERGRRRPRVCRRRSRSRASSIPSRCRKSRCVRATADRSPSTRPGVDRRSLRGVTRGDTVSVTGAADASADRFVAQSVQARH